MIIDLEKQFKPYTGDGHTVESMLKFLKQTAEKKGCSPDFVDLAVHDIFMEMKRGRIFSKTICSCGCGIDKAATDLIHTIRGRMLKIQEEFNVKYARLIQERLNMSILAHIREQNEAYMEENVLPPEPPPEEPLPKFADIDQSPVLKATKHVAKKMGEHILQRRENKIKEKVLRARTEKRTGVAKWTFLKSSAMAFTPL